MKTLLVGGGITSSLIGFFLRSCRSIISLDLWEMEEELGGRMKILRSEHSVGPIDIGAQYITTNTDHLEIFKDVYNSLIENDKIKELTCIIQNMKTVPQNTLNYIVPEGMNSLVTHFSNNNFQNVNFSHCVRNLYISGNLIEVETNNNVRESYEAVVLTMPIPCIFELGGNFKNFVDVKIYEKLKNVKYSSRYVLILNYNRELNVEWAANYLTDSIFKYVSIQEKKLGIMSSKSTAIFHTSVDFGEQFIHRETQEVQSLLMERVLHLFPEWKNPTNIVCYKWQYSQVTLPYENSPECVVLCSKPLLILAGDGFTYSNFNGCITSAKAAAGVLQRNCATPH